MSKEVMLKIGAGLLFTAVGLFLVIGSKETTIRTGKVNAQAGNSLEYTSDWSATKLLKVTSSGFFGNVPAQANVPIGVAEWHITAKDTATNENIYEETWKLPINGDVIYDPATQIISGGGFNPSDWIFANHIAVTNDTPNGGRVTYSVSALDPISNDYKYSFSNAKVGGNGVKCATNTDSNCLFSNGSYGWEFYHALSNMGSERGRISASGMMMPLKWKVDGTIF